MKSDDALPESLVMNEIRRLKSLRHDPSCAPGDRERQEDLARRIRFLESHTDLLQRS